MKILLRAARPVAAAFSIALAVLCMGAASGQPAETKLDLLRQVASSKLILDAAVTSAETRDGFPQIVILTLADDATIYQVGHWEREETRTEVAIDAAAWRELSGGAAPEAMGRVVFFLAGGDPRRWGTNWVALPGGVLKSTEATLGAVRQEIEEQQNMLAYWKVDDTAPDYAAISKTISGLTRAGLACDADLKAGDPAYAKSYQALIDRLIAAPGDHLPFIIDRMLWDMDLPLACRKMRLARSGPDAFGNTDRVYTPATVVDAVSAALVQSTGRDFGMIADGKDAADLAAGVSGDTVARAWAVFAARTFPHIVAEADEREPPLWLDVARADWIVEATLLAEPTDDSWSHYNLVFPADIARVVKKGGTGSIVEVRVMSEEAFAGSLRGAIGKRVLLFLRQTAGSVSAADGSGRAKNATIYAVERVVPAETVEAGEIVAEVGRQDALLAGWKPAADAATTKKVKAYIAGFMRDDLECDTHDKLPGEGDTQYFYERIVRLGPEAVSAIVALMDDRRELPCSVMAEPAIATSGLIWPWQTRTDDVVQVVDVLSLILTYITGESFRWRNAGEYDRQQVVKAWKIYDAAQRDPFYADKVRP